LKGKPENLIKIISRLEEEDCILFGHSLGGRIALEISEILTTKNNSQLHEVHLLGTAANNLQKENY